MTVVLVALAGAVGAVARAAAALRWPQWGIAAVNVAGSFLLGVVVEATSSGDTARVVLGVGFCGAFTTFSTFAAESYRLGPRYAVLTIAGSIAAAAVGTLVVP